MGIARARTGTEWLQRFSRRFRLLNVEIELGSPDAVEVLRRQDAEGLTIQDENGATILFRDAEPSLSVVLEEVTHVLQEIEHRFVHKDALVTMYQREIEVRECLILHCERLGIPEAEDCASKAQLEGYRANLERRLASWE
jgi:hypothetical protein